MQTTREPGQDIFVRGIHPIQEIGLKRPLMDVGRTRMITRARWSEKCLELWRREAESC
jgi:hypothetical protein